MKTWLICAALIVVALAAPGPGLAHPSLEPDLLDTCRRQEGDCVWITGKLIPPGSKETPTQDMCERYDRNTGSFVEQWPAGKKFHIFWGFDFWNHPQKANIFDSNWVLTCDR